MVPALDVEEPECVALIDFFLLPSLSSLSVGEGSLELVSCGVLPRMLM
jgi:hypothetical protein